VAALAAQLEAFEKATPVAPRSSRSSPRADRRRSAAKVDCARRAAVMPKARREAAATAPAPPQPRGARRGQLRFQQPVARAVDARRAAKAPPIEAKFARPSAPREEASFGTLSLEGEARAAPAARVRSGGGAC
jgi:hypothetical protein